MGWTINFLKNVRVLNYKFFKNRLSTPLSTLRNSWYWRFLSLPGAPWRFLALPVAPWRSLALLGAATGLAGLSELPHSNEYLQCSNQCMREGQGVEPRKREYRLMCMRIYVCMYYSR